MFAPNSRYSNLPTTEAIDAAGRVTVALTLRRLPPTEGQPRALKDNDELDRIALEAFDDATKFWHVADANTELRARDLLETGRVIEVPPS